MKKIILGLLLILLAGCSGSIDYIARGKVLLKRHETAEARLVFVEGYEHYREAGEWEKALFCGIYKEAAALDEGRFRQEIVNLERRMLELEGLENTSPDRGFKEARLLLSLNLIRGYLYAYNTEKANKLLDDSADLIRLLPENERDRIMDLKEYILSWLLYKRISARLTGQDVRSAGILREMEKPVPDSPSLRSITQFDGGVLFGQTKSFLKDFSLTGPNALALLWFAALSIQADEKLDTVERVQLLEEVALILEEGRAGTVAAYVRYYAARFLEESDSSKAIAFYNQALPVLKELGKEDFYLNTLSSLAILYYKRGSYLLSRDYFQLLLPLYGEQRENLAECTNYLAAIDKFLGNLTAAEKGYQEALVIYRELENREKQASIYNNLGIIYKDQLKYDKAFEYFRLGIGIVEKMIAEEAGREKPDSEVVRRLYTEKFIKANNIAEILISQGKYGEAMTRHLVTLMTEILGAGLTGSVIDATVKMNYAACSYFLIREEAYLSLEVCQPTLDILKESRRVFEESGEYVKVNEVRYLEGQIYFNSGEWELAEKVYLELKDFFTGSRSVAHLAGVCYSLYLTELELGRKKEAVDNLKISIENYDYFIRLIPSMEGQNRIYEKYLPYFKILIDELVSLGETEEAFGYSERMKARILLQQMQIRKLDPLITVPEDLKAKLAELSVRESALIKEFEQNYWIASLFQDFGYLDSIKKSLAEIESRREAIYHSLRVINAYVADINQGYASTLKEVQETLAPGELILNYTFSAKNFYLFLIDANSIEVVKLNSGPFDSKGFQKVIVKYRNALEDIYSDPSGEARYLYNLLLAPVEEKIRSGSHLVIVPSEELFYIPFEGLQSQGRYVIDRFPGVITYSISSSLLKQVRSREEKSFSMEYYGLGDPDYQGRISQLKFTRPELIESQALFGDKGKVFLGLEASEGRVKNTDLSPYRYVHFSCHGMNYGDSPFLSFPALLLASKPGAPDDGYLRHDEVSVLKIPAEMVLLSACQTGLGKIVPGDGLVGLNQAFFIAGADNVIASLWSVSDRYTKFLVTDFFTRLSRGKSYPVALKEAMLSIKAQQKQEYGHEHPFLWAPFVLTGGAGK